MAQLSLFTAAPRRMPTPSSRTLKVEALGDSYQGRTVPYIRLKGKWLREAGFREGGRVLVTVSNGRLVIEPVS